MADTNANPTASCGNGTMTARGYPVSMQTDCDCLLDNAAHKNSVLPNGCLKHSLEENGRVKPLENTDKTSITVCENLSKTDDACSCNDQRDLRLCECENVSKCTVASTGSTQCVNSKTIGLNGEHVQELESDASGVDTSSEGVAKLTLSESEYQESHSLEVKTSIGSTTTTTSICRPDVVGDLEYVVYESELQMPYIMRLITKDLSEPYSIYTYRYFIHNWPRLCFLTMDKGKYVGAIVCKHDLHKKMVRRGYIAMLAVDHNYRRNGVGSHLVMKAIRAMVAEECDEVVLETEITNKAALRLYENLGFLRDKRLFRYYLNGVDALRLKLWLR